MAFLPWAAPVFAAALLFIVWFFRDPERSDRAPENAVLAPADGRVVEIARVDEPDHLRGRALKIAVFMSLFDVHVNRSPCRGRVEWTRHTDGRFVNAMKARAGIENERHDVALRDERERPVLVRLVAGLVARRVVCPLTAGQTVGRGERIGMIKFGSRVELFLPDDGGFEVTVRLGGRVRAGESVLGVWR